MKKLFFASFMLLTLGLAASPVKDDLNVDPRVLSAFQKEFSFVKDAIWSSNGDVSQVSFSFIEQGFLSWY